MLHKLEGVSGHSHLIGYERPVYRTDCHLHLGARRLSMMQVWAYHSTGVVEPDQPRRLRWIAAARHIPQPDFYRYCSWQVALDVAHSAVELRREGEDQSPPSLPMAKHQAKNHGWPAVVRREDARPRSWKRPAVLYKNRILRSGLKQAFRSVSPWTCKAFALSCSEDLVVEGNEHVKCIVMRLRFS